MRALRFAAVGAALIYFLDPQQGARRRSMARDRVLAFVRGRRRDVAQLGRTAAGETSALKSKVAHRQEEPKDYDDQTLKAKVESEVFRAADAPKGDVDVNVEDGVVYLRGEVGEQSLIQDLEQRVRAVQGVAGVENLLHLPGSDAPARGR